MDVPRDRQVAISKEIETLANMLEELAKKLDSKLVLLDGIVLIAPEKKADQIASRYWNNKTSSLGNVWSKPIAAPIQWSTAEDTKSIADQLSQVMKIDKEMGRSGGFGYLACEAIHEGEFALRHQRAS